MKKINILFDYTQKELAECKVGNFVHSYHLARNLIINSAATLYATRPLSNPKKIEKETKVRFFTYWYAEKGIFLTHTVHFLLALKNKQKIDVVFSRYSYSWKQFAFLYRLLTRKRWIVEVGGVPWLEEPGFKTNRLLRKVFLYPLKKANVVIFYSSGIKEEILKEINLVENRTVIIPCGVDHTIFYPSDRNVPKKNGKIIFGYVGSIDRWQGLDTLIYAWRYLSDDVKNKIVFVIVGGGPDIERLKKLTTDNNLNQHITFTGKVTPEKVPDYVNSFDVCMAPFIRNRKASPIKVFEYMACGKLVIASDIPDVRELKLDNSIIYAEPENPESFGAAIHKAFEIENVNIYKTKSREAVLEKYTWERIVTQVYKTISELN